LNRLIVTLLLSGLIAQTLRAEDPEPTAPDAAETLRNVSDAELQRINAEVQVQIKALSSESYAERNAAREKLQAFGRHAIEPLESARYSEDPETRSAAKQLLFQMRGRGFLGIQLPHVGTDENGDPIIEYDDAGNPKGVPVVHVLRYEQDAAMMRNVKLTRPLPAEEAGIQENDVMKAINDIPLAGVPDLLREVAAAGPNRVIKITIERNGQLLVIPVRLTRNFSDPTPPVDLEAEFEKSIKLKAPAVEPARVTEMPATAGDTPKK
jgi:hypothetical protein